MPFDDSHSRLHLPVADIMKSAHVEFLQLPIREGIPPSFQDKHPQIQEMIVDRRFNSVMNGIQPIKKSWKNTLFQKSHIFFCKIRSGLAQINLFLHLLFLSAPGASVVWCQTDSMNPPVKGAPMSAPVVSTPLSCRNCRFFSASTFCICKKRRKSWGMISGGVPWHQSLSLS